MSYLFIYQFYVVTELSIHDIPVMGILCQFQSILRLYLNIDHTRSVCIDVYSIQHYVIQFVVGFLQVLQFPPPIKLTATI